MIRDYLSLADTEHKISPLPWQVAGRSYTATGYGRRIPSRYMIRRDGRWRRVYVCQYGNAGTAYIPNQDGSWTVVTD